MALTLHRGRYLILIRPLDPLLLTNQSLAIWMTSPNARYQRSLFHLSSQIFCKVQQRKIRFTQGNYKRAMTIRVRDESNRVLLARLDIPAFTFPPGNQALF